jgi:ankyrin repeat protein
MASITLEELFRLLTSISKIANYEALNDTVVKFKQYINTVGIINGNERTLLHAAIQAKNTTLVGALVANGANVNARDYVRDTPTHDAIYTEQLEIIKILHNAGADMYALNNNGNSPGMTAINSSQLDVIKLFAQLGYDFDKVINGKNALDYARRNGGRDVVKYLETLQTKSSNIQQPVNTPQTTIGQTTVQQPTVQQPTVTQQPTVIVPDVFRKMWKKLGAEEKNAYLRELHPNDFAQMQTALGADF